jgi:hypothetical protein
MNRSVTNKFTQEVLTEQAIEMAADFFISELRNKATKDQLCRLIALLEEINSNKALTDQSIQPGSVEDPVAALKYA